METSTGGAVPPEPTEAVTAEAVVAEAAVAEATDASTVPAARPALPPSSLSPSRVSDFMQCPLLYRFRVIDRLPEKPSEAATRGTLVHAVLERLFDAPAAERTAPRAKSLIPGQWDRLRETRPEVVELFADDPEGERLTRWLGEAEQLVERWFSLEDPTRLEPAERELAVEAQLDSGLKLRGIIDRVDVAPTGEVRIVDYKTGKAPRPEYAEGALFQMKFYALVVWRLKQVVPQPAPARLPRQRRRGDVRPDDRGPGAGRAQAARPVGGDPAGHRDWRLATEAHQALRLVRPPSGVPGIRRYSPPYPLPVRAPESGVTEQGRMGRD